MRDSSYCRQSCTSHIRQLNLNSSGVWHNSGRFDRSMQVSLLYKIRISESNTRSLSYRTKLIISYFLNLISHKKSAGTLLTDKLRNERNMAQNIRNVHCLTAVFSQTLNCIAGPRWRPTPKRAVFANNAGDAIFSQHHSLARNLYTGTWGHAGALHIETTGFDGTWPDHC